MILKCNQHKDQPLSYVCLDQKCSSERLLCYFCKADPQSNNQTTIILQKFIQSFLQFKSSLQNVSILIAQIDHQNMVIYHSLRKLKNKTSKFSIIEEAYLKFWNQFKSELLHFDTIVDDLSRIWASGDVIELKKWIDKNYNYYSDSGQQNETNKNIYLYLLQQKKQKLQEISQSIQKINQIASFDQNQLLQLFNVQKSTRKVHLHFTEELKGDCVILQSPTRAKVQQSGIQRMVLMQPALSSINLFILDSRNVKKWKIKIQKLGSWIGVGVSHLESVKAVNFDFSYTNPNHGNYLISSNGYSWNGYKMQFNSKFEPFSFGTGDIIHLTYDPHNSTIKFEKENEEKSYTYEIDPNQKPIHAAVNLTGVGDTVEILQ